MSKVLNLLRGVKTTRPIIPAEISETDQERNNFYLILFRNLLARVPAELSTSATAQAQIKMVQMALGNLSESNAMQLAQHIKALGRAIERAEIEAEIGRASCRERGQIAGAAESSKTRRGSLD